MGTFSARGLTLHFSDEGAGPPVVLLPSSGMTHRQWRALSRELSPRARVHSVDLLGTGGSSAQPIPFDVMREAELVAEWLTTFGAPVALGGHSYGGLVAMHSARIAPDAVARLALYEPVAFAVLLGGYEPRADYASSLQRMTLAEDGGSEPWLRTFVDYWQGQGAWDALTDGGRAMMLSNGPAVFQQVCTTGTRSITPAEVAQVKAPTLLMVGTRTQSDEAAVCARLAQLLPHVTFERAEGAGHMGPLTHPEVVHRLAQHLSAA